MFSKILVGYNNAFRKLLKLSYRCNTSTKNNVYKIRCEALIRSKVHSFSERLTENEHNIVIHFGKQLYLKDTVKHIAYMITLGSYLLHNL